jgi:hypothetical protein
MKRRNKVNSTQYQIFKLSSKHLICFSKSFLDHLMNFRDIPVIIEDNAQGGKYLRHNQKTNGVTV